MTTQDSKKRTNPICTCGGIPTDGSGTASPKVAVLTCAGGSNTGQIANAAGIKLAEKGVGYLACLAGVGAQAEGTLAKLAKARAVAVIDGCPVACARGMLDKAGIKVDYYLQVMDLGVKKDPGVLDPDPDAVARASAAAAEGIVEVLASSGTGRSSKPKKGSKRE